MRASVTVKYLWYLNANGVNNFSGSTIASKHSATSNLMILTPSFSECMNDTHLSVSCVARDLFHEQRN